MDSGTSALWLLFLWGTVGAFFGKETSQRMLAGLLAGGAAAYLLLLTEMATRATGVTQ